MKTIFKKVKAILLDFIESNPKPKEINLKANQLLHSIEKAQIEKTAIHVIVNNTSFSGQILKFDKSEGKLFLQNFQENVTNIISIYEIDRLTPIPQTIKKTQETTKETLI
ncbi:hypothetical protein HMPREF9318_00817 [Streptococcus urinalis FB127-CNA-2]|uniref:YolD-like protein n=1 Tax=Streptococcus urinalis 2285-97 TaxID=764291 RepID=G5KHV1_9STRE|nr:hypothetical protein [Streptococcus urinalis]EHJ57569.1 hypothetical protein STRUR_1536 [Streptococcus urinalis 2285-97]EKS22619.1 hypothetical protein HMPREF9318_00817 [Streptococcus urinalis FB127-CNA-2]VEF32388.1 Uncharacterised protein [Streptococcus urinalis]